MTAVDPDRALLALLDAAMAIMERTGLEVSCPQCGAHIGQECVTTADEILRIAPHVRRQRLSALEGLRHVVES